MTYIPCRGASKKNFETLAPLSFGTEIALKRLDLPFWTVEEVSAYFLCLFCGGSNLLEM